MLAIETNNLHKSYDSLPVLRGLHLSVESGEAYGLLGPNGSGKSTLIHLLLGYIKPNQGSIRVLGSSDLEETRSRVGYLPERLRYHLRYTAREYLRALGHLSDLGGAKLEARIDGALEGVGLADAADRMLGTYSKGMLQRFGIAQALLDDPELLLIDEPTAGLDPAGQHELIESLRELRRSGHTILMATHILDEAHELCDRVGVLYGGRIVAEVDVGTLRAPGAHVRIAVSALPSQVAERLAFLAPAVRCDERQITINPNSPELQARVLRVLLDGDVQILSLDPQASPLEDLYLRIVRGEQSLETPARMTGAPAAASPPAPAPPNGAGRAAGHGEATPPASPGRPRMGDTLLRELLGKDDDQRKRDDDL